MNSLNLEHLKAFVAVIDCGSFSAAAERLSLSQPAVSLQVRQLEKRLGATLIERVGRRAKPTAAGAALLVHAGHIDAAVASAINAVAPHASGALGRLRLGTGATACTYLLPPLLRDLRRRHPRVEITVTTGNTVDIVRAVEENNIDLGLVTLPAGGRSLEVEPVCDDEFVLVAPREMVLPARITAAVLARLPVMVYEPGGNTRRLIDDWFARNGITLQPVMSLGNDEAIKAMVAAGLGCAILTAMPAERERRSGALQVRSLSPRLHRTLAIVVRRDKKLHRVLGETIAALKQLG